MTDDSYALFMPITKGTPLYDDIVEQVRVSNVLNDMVGAPIMCKHQLMALVKMMSNEPPAGADVFDDGVGIPVSFNGRDFAGNIFWPTGEEPVFLSSLRIEDEGLGALIKSVIGEP